MIRIDNIKVYENCTEDEFREYVLKKYKIDENNVINFSIYKKSVDARDKENVHYNISVNITLKDERKYKKYIVSENKEINEKIEIKRNSKYSPVIVGSGPAGLFAALELINYGIKPVIIEQGSKVEKRIKDVEEYRKTGIVNENSNVQFGEGGAGTFSDGKLTTGINDKNLRKILETFVYFGAPKQILYVNKPHIGTDNLVNIVKNIRKYIIEKGGTFLFDTKVVDFDVKDNKVTSVKCSDGKVIETDTIVLAIGHSARDMFFKLKEKHVHMEKKNFSVGVRIEHLQEDIDKSQYGIKTKLNLPKADYKLVYHGEERSCYSFCMCPGGVVMPSASENESIVTNGMSTFKRDLKNANSALLVNVTPEDFKEDDVLAGIEFQRNLEKSAYVIAGKNGNAPCQKVGDFINNKASTSLGSVMPTYMPSVTLCNLNEIFPEFVSKTLKEAIIYFGTKIEAFKDMDAVLTGVETRSSSPVRIVRNEKLMCDDVYGLYPCGEGAGYAGGIMSAAADGIKVARAIINNN